MEQLIESKSHYPYVLVSLEVGEFKKTDEALADTGFDLSLRIPKNKFDNRVTESIKI